MVELIEKRNRLSQSGNPTTCSVNIGEDMSCPSEQKNNEGGKKESNGGLVPQLAVEGEIHNSLSKSKKKKLKHRTCSSPIIISDDEESKSSSEKDCEVDKLTLTEEKEQVPVKETLPLTFQFEDEEPLPPEKEEWEKETDDLFAEMDMCIGFTSPSVSPMQIENLSGCQMGNHHLILDEEIGLICEVCFHVHLESKYIFPPFAQRSQGRY
ncbi:uncharacterized protein LOC129875258 [Solanum dulcamara]|uniref:uncharacterized protein LOC129875258 n=1 Tax=Solanum dulcamara TaxID=45834 RepID=UPI002485B8C4|nr:uncharacterized protein LOC129875258 [Solanum dulcamara]